MNDVPLRRFVVDACDGPFGSAIKSEHYAEDGARVIRLGNIGTGQWRDESKAFLSLGYWRQLSSHHARAGDVIMAGLGDAGHPVGRACVVPNSIGHALVKADCYRLRLNPRLAEARFIAAFLSSSAGLEQAVALAEGSTRQRLTLSKAMSIRVPRVPVGMQRGIADFLDSETARIDALIAKKRKMILLLEEAGVTRQQCFATNGTRPWPMRSSGYEWLGAIPDHWNLVRLKFLAKLESGHTPSRTRPELWENCTTPWVTLNDVGYLENHEFIDQTVNLISPEGLANSSARILPPGTVVLSRDATVGRCGILTRPAATSQHFADWICSSDLRPRYLWLIFRMAMQKHFESLTDGATLRTIGLPDINELVIPLPPVQEQDDIVTAAESVRLGTSKVVGKLTHQISLFAEHRQTLITAAITGELDVTMRIDRLSAERFEISST